MYNKSIKKNTTFPSFFISWNFFVIFFFKYHFLMWMKWLWYPNSYNTRFFICFWTCFIFKFCQISTIFAYYFLIGRQSQRSCSQFDVSNDSNAFIYWLNTYFYQKYIKNECLFVYILCILWECVWVYILCFFIFGCCVMYFFAIKVAAILLMLFLCK